MTKLSRMMLDVAGIAGNVVYGVATGGSVTSLIDSALNYPAESFTEGTLWLLGGDNAGEVTKIVAQGSNGAMTISALPLAIAAGDAYAIADRQFPLNLLKQSCLTGLKSMKIMLVDETLVGVDGQTIYTLPQDVRDVRRVEIGGVVSFFWKTAGDLLIFDEGKSPSAGAVITLRYAGLHPDANEGDELLQYDIWALWSAVVFLWRRVLQTTHKDNSIAMDLFNEAKMTEAATRRVAKPAFPRDPHLNGA